MERTIVSTIVDGFLVFLSRSGNAAHCCCSDRTARPSWLSRRRRCRRDGGGNGSGPCLRQIAAKPDYSLRIAPLRLELAPGKVIDTYGYNVTVPGPVLRLREGQAVSIDISNNTDIDDIIHWHGADSGDCGQGFRLIADSHSDRSRTAFR